MLSGFTTVIVSLIDPYYTVRVVLRIT